VRAQLPQVPEEMNIHPIVGSDFLSIGVPDSAGVDFLLSKSD
jgi:hypothetical protein